MIDIIHVTLFFSIFALVFPTLKWISLRNHNVLFYLYQDSLILFCLFSPYDRPRLIETLQGKGVVEIACGGAHSAAITSLGELYTWGKGRYGRLGHGDSEVRKGLGWTL